MGGSCENSRPILFVSFETLPKFVSKQKLPYENIENILVGMPVGRSCGVQ